MLHKLKTWKPFFDEIISDRKTFEIRKNDRGFMVNDTLLLQEYDPKEDTYSGREVYKDIKYIYEGTGFGVEYGYVVMSIS